MTDILIPPLSENITSGTVITIAVRPGDKVAKGQSLLELETEKAVLEVPSPLEGFITEVLINKGDQVKVGQVVFRASSEAVAAPAVLPAPLVPSAEKPVIPSETVGTSPVPVAPADATTMGKPQRAPDAALSDIAAAPSVRRLAREIGVNIAEVTGTGPHSRISIEDVKAHAKTMLTVRGSERLTATVIVEPLPDFTKWGEVAVEPLSAIRKKTAEHLSSAWATIPHVTHFAKADITELDKLRQQYSTDGRKLSVLPFIMKVVAVALKNFPRFNASLNMAARELIYKKYYNIGVAVDTEHGLLVPVVRDVGKKSILVLADELKALSEQARNRKLTIEEMQGGTFTISNLGSITGGFFTPIVNSPEVAILGLSRAELEPHYGAGPACSPRLMLPLSLSYDHRVIDGAEGARFIQWVTDAIQQPFLLELK